jgi:retron-type reverse transcriptase
MNKQERLIVASVKNTKKSNDEPRGRATIDMLNRTNIEPKIMIDYVFRIYELITYCCKFQLPFTKIFTFRRRM